MSDTALPFRTDTAGRLSLSDDLAEWLQNLAYLAKAKTKEDFHAAVHLSNYLRSREYAITAGVLRV